jgi:hypothetical protein
MDCVNITPTEVRIQVTDYIKHDGYTQHLIPLYRTLHQLRHELENKSVRFIFREAEPFKLVSFDNVIQHVSQTYKLSKDRIIIDTIDHIPRLSSDFATIVTTPSSSLDLARQLIKVDQCQLNNNPALFGAFFGRFTTHRFLMAYFLETQIQNSIVAFHPNVQWAEFEFESVKKYFVKELEWLKNRQEKNANLNSGHGGAVSSFDCLPVYHEIFGLYNIEVVLETNIYECGWFTEKTAKCLVAGKPFLLLGTSGQLDELRRLGFQTFSPWINESYDLESNPEKRFDMICNEIRRIAGLDEQQQQDMINEINARADYNKINYCRLIEDYVGRKMPL